LSSHCPPIAIRKWGYILSEKFKRLEFNLDIYLRTVAAFAISGEPGNTLFLLL
jgi:hypothetical protein